jgi:hypothetical protein
MAEEKLVQPPKFKQPTYAAPFIETDARSAVYLGNAHIDNLMQVVYSLGTEIWVDRQRARIVERLLEQKKPVTREAIEQYIPSDEERAAWQAEQDAMVRRLYAVLARDTSGHRPFGKPRFGQS